MEVDLNKSMNEQIQSILKQLVDNYQYNWDESLDPYNDLRIIHEGVDLKRDVPLKKRLIKQFSKLTFKREHYGGWRMT